MKISAIIVLLSILSTQTYARELIVESSTPVRAVQAIEFLKKGLLPKDRSFVVLRQTSHPERIAVSVDLKHQSASPNFKILRQIFLSDFKNVVVAVKSKTETFSSQVGQQVGAEVVVVPFENIFGVKNYVSKEDGMLGMTLIPLVGNPLKDLVYSPDAYTRIYIAPDSEVSEGAATIHHEFRHALFCEGGLKPSQALHFEKGVNEETAAAEAEAKKNAKLADLTSPAL